MVCGMVLWASHESSSTKNTRKMSIKGSVCEEIQIKLRQKHMQKIKRQHNNAHKKLAI